jgi:alkyl hydroperoxide reductase subunit AhpF
VCDAFEIRDQRVAVLFRRNGVGHVLFAERSRDGAIVVNEHQRTRVPGVYAAGDVVDGLNQLSVAVGHAAQAACGIHHWLLTQKKGGSAAPM